MYPNFIYLLLTCDMIELQFFSPFSHEISVQDSLVRIGCFHFVYHVVYRFVYDPLVPFDTRIHFTLAFPRTTRISKCTRILLSTSPSISLCCIPCVRPFYRRKKFHRAVQVFFLDDVCHRTKPLKPILTRNELQTWTWLWRWQFQAACLVSEAVRLNIGLVFSCVRTSLQLLIMTVPGSNSLSSVFDFAVSR